MKTENTHLGYFEIDHRFSPGTALVPEGRYFEDDLLMCGHCQRLVLKNQERQRDRYKCRRCFEYVCDFCGDPLLTGCLNFNALLDQLQEEAFLRLNLKEI